MFNLISHRYEALGNLFAVAAVAFEATEHIFIKYNFLLSSSLSLSSCNHDDEV